MNPYCTCWPIVGCNPYCPIHGYLELLTWAATNATDEPPQFIKDRLRAAKEENAWLVKI